MNKKQVILTGRLAAPLCEGSRAWIRHHSGLVCTSRVVRIQSLTDRKAVFETMNSMYHVSLETYPFVMDCRKRCAHSMTNGIGGRQKRRPPVPPAPSIMGIMGSKEANIPIYATVKPSVNLCPFPRYQTC